MFFLLKFSHFNFYISLVLSLKTMDKLWGFNIFLVIFLSLGCKYDMPKTKQLRIVEEFIIPKGDSLVLGPGSEVLIDSGLNIIAYGDVIIRGTKNNPVHIKGTEESGWGVLSAKGSCQNFIIHHAVIENGRITSYQSNNHFKNVLFKNNQPLVWNDALARFWFGVVLIENCTAEGINKGEGFLLHNVQHPDIRNCTFRKVPDAIEYIDCKNGQIVGNYFEKSNDDAIDQNSCFNILIKDNQIFDAEDCGMELGSEKFGSCDSLKVFNNLIVNCRKGINIKESSSVVVEQSTFYNNKISIDVNTPEDSTRVSRVVINRSVFEGKTKPIVANNRSETVVSNCLSSVLLPSENENKVAPIKFKNPDLKDFQIISLEVQNIGFRPEN